MKTHFETDEQGKLENGLLEVCSNPVNQGKQIAH